MVATECLGRFARIFSAKRLASVVACALLTLLLVPSPASAKSESNRPTKVEEAQSVWLSDVADVIGATELLDLGYTGKGVDVAVIDTGVSPVPGLADPARVVNGPDFSYNGRDRDVRHLDGFGHGTNMAGIIAGSPHAPVSTGSHFTGMAPSARIVNVRVGDSAGNVKSAQVVAALDWVVAHRHADGLNIRVVNLSYGIEADLAYVDDPVATAVERAWDAGIVVVVAGGNDGRGIKQLASPATDPYVIAVGASDTSHGSVEVPWWSSTGDGTRNPDIVAPGAGVASLRVPGSYLETLYPSAVVGGSYFRGSGTSQAAAVVSGGVALLLEARPDLTPDQVKALLTTTAEPLKGKKESVQGHGLVQLDAALDAPTPDAIQTHTRATAKPDDGASAEVSFAGSSWTGSAWSGSSWTGSAWSGSAWTGSAWSGSAWSGDGWY